MSVPPALTAPLTAFMTLLALPVPPLALLMPAPPAPPICTTDAEADVTPMAEAVALPLAPPPLVWPAPFPLPPPPPVAWAAAATTLPCFEPVRAIVAVAPPPAPPLAVEPP